MRPYAIGALQLEVQQGDNMDHACTQIRDLMRRFPWVQMVLLS